MQDQFQFDRFEVRATQRLLLIEGQPAELGARAFDLLLCLLLHRDRVVSKGEILDLVWPGLVVEENNLSVQVSALRKVLGSQAIATIPGRGYRFALDLLPDSGLPQRDALRPQAADAARPTIAVLPFIVLSDDPQVSFLADGLVEDVIALLARVPGFMLISRASSFAFRGHDVTVPDVAQQLGVRFVVEGSVRLVGDALRVSTQLIEAATGRVLWTGRFDRRRNEAVDLQEDIARGVMSELEPELTRAEIAHIRRQRPENQDAWAHYHQAVGSLALQGWGHDAMAEARQRLQTSVALDPAFGLGHAHYALLTALSMNIGAMPNDPGLALEALGAARQAMALDDGNSEVLGYAGCALCDLGYHEQGVDVLLRALEIDPSNAQAHVALGASWVLSGQLDAGIERMRYGMKISPRDRRLGFWGWALGNFLLRAERLDEAFAEARTSSRRDPRFSLPRVLEAAILDRQGKNGEARAALTRARQISPTLTLDAIAQTHGRHVGKRLALFWDVAN
ncbi:MAG: winged helix-turn-helix domain-containing protein [Hydrogenophaga sp.]|nr:winged helix-turn-helix domain-containing protein [Hydrogenophaga sp.]